MTVAAPILLITVRALIFLVAIVSSLAVIGACASTPAAVRPEAFPRARPLPNATSETNGAASPEAPLTPRVTPAPRLASPAGATSALSAAVLETALELLGTKYRFGGETPDTGFDCSGFVSYVLRQHAIEFPRTVAEQFAVGQPVAQDQIQPGDLVFFTTTGPGATHVGIVVNTGTRWDFVHAPADGSTVRVERFDTGYWQQRWIGARRAF